MILADLDGEIVALVVVLASIGGMVWIVKIIADGFRKARLLQLDAQLRENHDRLKALMLQRGMNADEIERVLAAGAAAAPHLGQVDAGDNPEMRIVKVLSNNGYGGSDVDRILAAARAKGPITADAAELVETMANNWSDGDDIERVLRGREFSTPRVSA